MRSAEFLARFFQFLNQEVEYAVLRNFEGLPERNDSRDIDIAIRRRDYRRMREPLARLVESCGWKVVTLLRSDRLVTWVVGAVGTSDDYDLVQLDFFFDTSVFGVRLLSADQLLERRVWNGAIYHASREIEFLDKYLYDRAVGARYPDKYRSTRLAVENGNDVKTQVKRIFGVNSVADCDAAPGRKLLLYAALRAPLKSVFRFVRFEHSRILNYLRGTGFSIGFTGPDGAGKTTVIDLMIEKLGPVFRSAHAYYHFRPTLFGNLGEVAHSAGLKKEVDRNYADPHRGAKTGVASSLARLSFYSIDYILGYFVKVKSKVRITRLVIFDRYFTDIICDSRRTRIYLPKRLLYAWQRLFIPSLDYNILLTASTSTILSRKRELEREGIESINAKIDFLAPRRGYLKVVNEGAPEEAVHTILSHIFDHQHRLNLRRLKYRK